MFIKIGMSESREPSRWDLVSGRGSVASLKGVKGGSSGKFEF